MSTTTLHHCFNAKSMNCWTRVQYFKSIAYFPYTTKISVFQKISRILNKSLACYSSRYVWTYMFLHEKTYQNTRKHLNSTQDVSYYAEHAFFNNLCSYQQKPTLFYLLNKTECNTENTIRSTDTFFQNINPDLCSGLQKFWLVLIRI